MEIDVRADRFGGIAFDSRDTRFLQEHDVVMSPDYHCVTQGSCELNEVRAGGTVTGRGVATRSLD